MDLHNHVPDHDAVNPEGLSDVPAEYPMSSLLDGLPETQHNQLLEMLHVPLLHGGVKEAFLLPSFTTSDTPSFALACFLLAITACLLELLRLAAWYVEGQYMSDGNSADSSSCACKQCALSVLSLGSERKSYNTMHNIQDVDASSGAIPAATEPSSSCLCRCLALASVGVLQFFTYLGSTLLMLVAMTMNIFFILSLGVGASLGKLTTLYLKRHLKEARK
uniref:Copper transport protein n=2 Tax=Scylla olivacea TaxID=85551 RepID=A0A0P4WAR2_SCYOL